jgi:hypothetical protein
MSEGLDVSQLLGQVHFVWSIRRITEYDTVQITVLMGFLSVSTVVKSGNLIVFSK